MGGCTTTPAPGGPQWIALTPLTPSGLEPGASWYPGAVSQILRNELALVPGLMVIVAPVAANAVTPLPDEVDWILEGTVGRQGGHTRFDLTLRRKSDVTPSWQRRFEYAADGDASQWRLDIPATLAAHLGVANKGATAGDLGPCRSAPAADATLRAIGAYGSYRTRADLLRVRAGLEAALQHEPGCVEASTQHLMTQVSELGNRWSSDTQAQMQLADRLSRQAVIDTPLQPFAHLARLQVLRLQRQIEPALQEAAILTRLDPSNSLFLGRLAALQYDLGDAPATLVTARRMQRLPSGTLAALQQGLLYEGMAQFSMGEEQQSAAVLRRLVDLNPHSSFAWLMLASIAALHGREAEASAALQRYRASSPPDPSIKRLRANETTVPDGRFKQQRERYYAGLRLAGLAE